MHVAAAGPVFSALVDCDNRRGCVGAKQTNHPEWCRRTPAATQRLAVWPAELFPRLAERRGGGRSQSPVSAVSTWPRPTPSGRQWPGALGNTDDQ